MNKRAALVAGDQVIDVQIAPGTTTHDVRRQANLPDSHFISPREGLPWGEHEVIYDKIRDGEKIFANAKVNVAD